MKHSRSIQSALGFCSFNSLWLLSRLQHLGNWRSSRWSFRISYLRSLAFSHNNTDFEKVWLRTSVFGSHILIVLSLGHISSGISLLWFPPFKIQACKDPLLSRQQILRLPTDTLKINPMPIFPAPDTTTVKLQILHLLGIPS
jgi:hypothetical protein